MSNIKQLVFQVRLRATTYVDFSKGSNFLRYEQVVQNLKNKIANEIERHELNIPGVSFDVSPAEFSYTVTPLSGTVPSKVLDTDLSLVENTDEFYMSLLDALELVALDDSYEIEFPESTTISRDHLQSKVKVKRIK